MLLVAMTLNSNLWLISLQPPEGVSESLALAQLQGELVGVQSSLFSLGLELEASQRSLRQSQRQGDDLMRFRDRLSTDLQEVLQHREVTEKHNQVSRSNKVKPFRMEQQFNIVCLNAAGPPLCNAEDSLRVAG